MAISQKRSRRKPSGGLLKRKLLKKRLANKGDIPTLTKVGPTKTKTVRTRGGSKKFRLLSVDTVNLATKDKIIKAKVKTVVDNPADKNYIRRNILTKGAIIETDHGKARITSRPGQEKVLNAVLIE